MNNMRPWMPGLSKPLGYEERRNAMLIDALLKAKEKLILYRAQHSGEYIGGMEYAMLISLIDAALKE